MTPSFNQVGFIEETITSILHQNYAGLEYVIADGGSTDGSIDIIEKNASKLKWWCSEPDDGQSDAIMKGFNQCTGDLFAWVNSDDVLFPHCFDMVARYYVKKNKPDIITANIAYIDANSTITRFIRVPRQSRLLFYRGVWWGTAPCVFFKRSLFEKVGGLQHKYHLSMDVDIWVRMMAEGARVVHIPSYMGGFRIHPSAKTTINLQVRRTKENYETTEIFNEHLVGSTQRSRALWRLMAKGYRAMSLNYLLMCLDYKKLPPGIRWDDYVELDAYKKQFER